MIRAIGAGILSGVLFFLCVPPISAWGLVFFAFVPALLICLSARSMREVIAVGSAMMVTFSMTTFHWITYVATQFGDIPQFLGVLILFGFSLFAEIQILAFLVLLVKGQGYFKTVTNRTLYFFGALPSLYVVLDYSNPKIFPDTFGHILSAWLELAQVAEVVGVYGLTFLVILVNVAVALVIAGLLRSRRPAWFWHPLPSVRSSLIVLFVSFLFILGIAHWGANRIEQLLALEQSFSRSFKVSVIQANIGDVDKLASEQGYYPAVRTVLETYQSMSIKSVDSFHPDLVVWPETAYPYRYTHFKDLYANSTGAARDQWIADLMARLKTPLLFGTYTRSREKEYNAAFLLEPPFRLAGFYTKYQLLPFGEYVPLGPFSELVYSWIPTIAHFGRGPGPQLLDLNGIRLAPQICYEGIFPEHSRQGAREGADLLVNITNDSWFGRYTEPWLHLMLTAFRSIETRRPLLRATNTGITTFIAMTGEKRWKTRLFEPVTFEMRIALPDSGKGQQYPDTFYLKYGEVFVGLCYLLVSVLVLICVRSRRYQQMKTKQKMPNSGGGFTSSKNV